jgi:phosphoribosyl-ATP pyrophosphohydrolase
VTKAPKRSAVPADPEAPAAGKKAVAGAKPAKKPRRKAAAKAAVKQSRSAAKAAVKQSRTAAARVADLSGAGPAVLDRLFAVVTSRRDADPTVSHSARLLSRGTAKVAQKFGEEAVECLIEAVGGNSAALIGESADVLYHLIVLWVDAGVRPVDVWNELARREGTSGIAEKNARPREP